MDLAALVFVAGGSAVLGVIGGHLLTDHRQANARRRLGDRNAELSTRLKRALDGERDAQREAETLRSEQGVWAKRLLAMKAEVEKI